MSADHLFVYGSLKRGSAPPEIADVMDALIYVGLGSLRGRFHGGGPYPGATFDESFETEIAGEIYALPQDCEETLRRLDEYEDFFPEAVDRSLFIRQEQLVLDQHRRRIRCWVYACRLPAT